MKCAGCDVERVPLTRLSNGRDYCARCAEEVVAMGWAN